MDRTTKSKTRRVVTTGILGLTLLSLVPLTAQAFGRRGKVGPTPDRALTRLTEELDLTAEQQGQVKAVLEENFAERNEIREAHRQEMETLREQNHTRLSAVLTPEQVEKLDQLRDERRERVEWRRDCDGNRGRRGGRQGPTD